MSPSRSAITVRQAAPAASSAPACSVAVSQRRLSFCANGRALRCAFDPPRRRSSSAWTSPNKAPSCASMAIVGCNTRLCWSPSSRRLVVSWIAKMCRPATNLAVRAAAVCTISAGVTRGLRRNRVIRISPARLPPSVRTRTLDCPTAASRSSKNSPLFPGGGRQTAPAPLSSPPSAIPNDLRDSEMASQRKPLHDVCIP